ncbi:hypothetical protein HUJ05_010948 [Dendroctonus ponderosae]|nr:hypothetical protein HUJ05_010948 [Dendroctonus ponderosae]
MQFPNDATKIVCYGNESAPSEFFHVTVLTLPASCVHCADAPLSPQEGANGGWCPRHGFLIHFMFASSQLAPPFDPHVSLGYPHHLVVNTGHHVHILNISTAGPFHCANSLTHWVKEEPPKPSSSDLLAGSLDAFSEISESASCSSLVDAILDDFSEYDLDGSEAGKPFHELNISCEPLNVTGKTYHNTLVQSILDPRLKRLQGTSRDYVFSVPHASQKLPPEKSKVVDKKVAEKAYEFTEETEKYEKISLFRKKRLADKKYEFSEDNTENIVPFHILRRERTFLVRPQLKTPLRSPESFFLSPRSPMQSPSSRTGQFSPSVRRSPISPRETARKVNVYSPSLGSDCSDGDGRLVLRPALTSGHFSVDASQTGLLIVDPKVEASKWIKKVVRRFSNGDFENSSLLSGQSRGKWGGRLDCE